MKKPDDPTQLRFVSPCTLQNHRLLMSATCSSLKPKSFPILRETLALGETDSQNSGVLNFLAACCRGVSQSITEKRWRQ